MKDKLSNDEINALFEEADDYAHRFVNKLKNGELRKPIEPKDPCFDCKHTDEECKGCYPELGYKNDKLKRDTEAVEELVNSPYFEEFLKSLTSSDNLSQKCNKKVVYRNGSYIDAKVAEAADRFIERIKPKSALAEMLGVSEEEAKRQVYESIDEARRRERDGVLSKEETEDLLKALGSEVFTKDCVKGIKWETDVPTALVEPVPDDAIGIEFVNGYAKGKADMQERIDAAIKELEVERDKWIAQGEGKYPMNQIECYQYAIDIIRKHIEGRNDNIRSSSYFD